MATEQQYFNVTLPDGLTPSQRMNIAADVIEYIQERTKGGNDNRGRKFKEYTKDYAEKKGVGVGDVDLIDTLEMVSSLQLLRVRKNNLKIGYKAGDDINGKVEGNQIGSYGQPNANPKKARPFLDFKGSEKAELRRIIKDNL